MSSNRLFQKTETITNMLASHLIAIRELNKARSSSEHFPLVDKLRQVTNLTNLSRVQDNCLNDVWEIISDLAESNRNKRGSNSKSSKLQCLILASKSWLEKKYQQGIENTLFKYATRVKVGGLPSQSRRILAYLRFMYQKSDGTWRESDLELQKEVPIWLYLFLLLRSGHESLALGFVEIENDLFRLSPNFPSYLKEYFQSSHRILSESSRKMILLEYQQMEYGIGSSDPYKKLIYKILGRCEMDKPIETNTKEDDLWLQLSLIRELEEDLMYNTVDYGLKDLQKKLSTEQSDKHNSKDINTWNYFTTLLLSLQFEKAIGYLYEIETFKFEATHFAIVLAYYGLLQNTKKPFTHKDSLVSVELDGSISLDFAKLISSFVDTFIQKDQKSIALEYLSLITLYTTQEMADTYERLILDRE